ncbi:MAG: hypothetical protein JWM80_3781 [Cyanobacteria bacterium RYN_339]|nr:hypothetical protein [Cyanobacteria bacterium RYN_339]
MRGMRHLLLLVCLAGCAPAATFQPPNPAASGPPVATNADLVPTGKFLFYEDFENGTEKWELPATGWQLLNAYSCGGKFTMLLPDTGRPGESYFTLRAPLDLGKLVKPLLKYDVKGLTTPEDATVIQAEVRPPGQDWRPLGHDARGNHAFAAAVVADLKPYAGQTVGLRFHGTTKAGQADTKGMYLDDVGVIEPD